MSSDTIGAVLQTKQQRGESIPSTTVGKRAKPGKIANLSRDQILALNTDKANWEWVEVPDTDLFGETHTGVSINFEHFGPGKYFVSPELSGEIKRLLANRMRGDIRVLQPRQDAAMAAIMNKSQLGAPVNSNLQGLNEP